MGGHRVWGCMVEARQPVTSLNGLVVLSRSLPKISVLAYEFRIAKWMLDAGRPGSCYDVVEATMHFYREWDG